MIITSGLRLFSKSLWGRQRRKKEQAGPSNLTFMWQYIRACLLTSLHCGYDSAFTQLYHPPCRPNLPQPLFSVWELKQHRRKNRRERDEEVKPAMGINFSFISILQWSIVDDVANESVLLIESQRLRKYGKNASAVLKMNVMCIYAAVNQRNRCYAKKNLFTWNRMKEFASQIDIGNKWRRLLHFEPQFSR